MIRRPPRSTLFPDTALFRSNENITQYRQFDDVQGAVDHLEGLHNVEGNAGARLFRLDEVEFAVTSYVKVEIGASTSSTTDPAPEGVVYTEATAPESVDVGDGTERVEYVEAATAPVDAFAPVPAASHQEPAEESAGSGEVRRGLFGR